MNKSETEKIKEFIQKHNKVVLWGCGSFSIQLFAKYPDLKKSIVYAVDNNSKIQENGFEGLKVYSPKELFNNPYPVLICSMLNGKDIAKEIDEMSLSLDYFLF